MMAGKTGTGIIEREPTPAGRLGYNQIKWLTCYCRLRVVARTLQRVCRGEGEGERREWRVEREREGVGKGRERLALAGEAEGKAEAGWLGGGWRQG